MASLTQFGEHVSRYETNGSALIAPELRESRTHLPKKEILQVADYRMRHNQYSELSKTHRPHVPCQDADLTNLFVVWSPHALNASNVSAA